MEVSENLHEQAKGHLRAFVERIERVEEEKAALAADIKEIYAEAKSNGFDTKAIRKIVSMRKKEEHSRLEEEAILATYMHAMGMIGQLADTPLGEAALAKIGHNSKKAAEASGTPEPSSDTDMAHKIGLARQAGSRAAEDGKRLVDVPYLSDDPRYGAWMEGFRSVEPVAA